MIVGRDQPFQILDENGVELSGADWSIDSTEAAELELDSAASPVLHAKAAGTVRIIAALEGHVEEEEIRVWPLQLPQGSEKWRIHSLGVNLKILPAFPTENSDVDLFSLDQNERGTYLRGYSTQGMQRFLWVLPEAERKVKIVCGDFLGNAILAVSHDASYVLYVVGSDGVLKWRKEFSGILNAYTVGTENILFLFNQPTDRSTGTIVGVDEVTGKEQFRIELPGSNGDYSGLRNLGSKVLCGGSADGSLPIHASRMFINIDGNAYIAFTQYAHSVTTSACQENTVVDEDKMTVSTDDRLVLWRIHPDGTFVSYILERMQFENVAYGAPLTLVAPTGEIIPDGLGGVLVSVRRTQVAAFKQKVESAEEFIYRANPEGEVVYHLKLPPYEGALHDGMVLGVGNTGFATRGDIVLKFDVVSGIELFERKLPGTEAEVLYSTAVGGVVVRSRDGRSVPLNAAPK
jgi:hypothetical protein